MSASQLKEKKNKLLWLVFLCVAKNIEINLGILIYHSQIHVAIHFYME